MYTSTALEARTNKSQSCGHSVLGSLPEGGNRLITLVKWPILPLGTTNQLAQQQGLDAEKRQAARAEGRYTYCVTTHHGHNL